MNQQQEPISGTITAPHAIKALAMIDGERQHIPPENVATIEAIMLGGHNFDGHRIANLGKSLGGIAGQLGGAMGGASGIGSVLGGVLGGAAGGPAGGAAGSAGGAAAANALKALIGIFSHAGATPVAAGNFPSPLPAPIPAPPVLPGDPANPATPIPPASPSPAGGVDIKGLLAQLAGIALRGLMTPSK